MQVKSHLSVLIHDLANKYGDKTALTFKKFGSDKWQSVSWNQFSLRVKQVSNALLNIGAKPHDKIAVFSQNCVHYLYTDFGAYGIKVCSIPFYATSSEQQIQYMINDGQVRFLFVGEQDQYDKAHRVFALCPSLERIIIFDSSVRISTHDPAALYFKDFIKLGENLPRQTEVEALYQSASMDDMANILYTSGSTGDSKGVMLTYKALSATIDFGQRHIPSSDKFTMVSMLPMAHMYGLVYEFLYPLCNGTSITFLGKTPSPTLLLSAMRDVKPYLLITVPLVMEKVFKSAIKPVVEKPVMKVLTRIPGIKSLLFKKIREKLLSALGGNLQMIIMGGAPLNPEVEKWFKKLGLPYTVGYGMTEAAPLLAYEPCDSYVPGSCGKSVDCATVRIDSDDPQHVVGEIQAKGDNICLGYYKAPEATAAAFTEDGYLKTGDLGIIDAEGNIFIKGRSKSMILSANGQNIYPEEVEAVVNNQDYVVESVVVDRASKLVALIYLDQDAIRKNGLDAETVADIPERVRIASNRALPSYSQLQKVEVVDKPFEKTPKMSIKRFMYK